MHPSPVTTVLLTLVAVFACATAEAQHPPIEKFLESWCVDCHSGPEAEAGFEITTQVLSLESLASAAAMDRGVRVFDRVAQGEMPPPDADQPPEEMRREFLSSLGDLLTAADEQRQGTVLRRLNRREYQNTLNDLFGTHLDLAELLPEDGRAHTFSTVGDALSLSPVHLQRYLEAADTVLDAAISNEIGRPQPKTVLASYADTREAERFLGKKWLQLEDGAVVFFRQWGYPTGMLREATVRQSGRYRIRVTGYGYQTTEPITFSIGSTTFARGAEKPTYGFYAMPPGEPTTIEIEAWIDDRYMIQIEPWGISDNNEIKRVGIENYDGAGLAILAVEVEGPLLAEYPSRGHRLLFDGLDRREIPPRNPRDRERSWYRPKFKIVLDDPVHDVIPVLQRVARAAFRRPVAREQIAAYDELFRSEHAAGASIEEALRTAVSAILCSPDFLFLHEPPGKLNDNALASRLSYFLTRTSPDDELRELASGQKLAGNNDVLVAETARLIEHPHFDRFIIDLTDEWLDLRNINFTVPDRKLFPEYDPFLQHSMLQESRAFLRELVEQNLSVRCLVRSDFAMLNNRLAEHYGIDGVAGPKIRRVALAPESPRGGVLSQGSVLKVSANGTNTSPVVRGVWVMERLLGKTPPPPPAGVPGVEPDIRGGQTLRELLELHRDSDNCRHCHAMIDPPGFALESFNPIGGWRERYRSLGEGERLNRQINGRRVQYRLAKEVDASGTLPNGQAFSGFREFRRNLAADENALARAFLTNLLVFATGREMGFSDRPEIDRLVSESARRNHGVRDMILLVVTSEIFQHK